MSYTPIIQSHRTTGGLINRRRDFAFTFDNRQYFGYEGDTVASALVANGVKLVGRSFKYHRPRGLFSAGTEEPNALLTIGKGADADPNTRATVQELFDGLSARSQNYRGTLTRDFMAVNDLLAPFLSAGFYYKTFMWPAAFWEKLYEPIIRAAAGLGRLSGEEDPSVYDKGFLHCDVLIIGAGPAGLKAAYEAGTSGANVILADDDFLPGGRLNAETYEIDGKPGALWALDMASALKAMPNVRLMTRTTVYGVYDHGIYGALENRIDGASKPRQILWRIYAKASILCAGSTERSIAFGNNDRPGIMLAGAVRTYANRYAALAGREIAVFTNNDDGWKTIFDLQKAGASVPVVIDSRADSTMEAPAGVRVVKGEKVINTQGRHCVHQLELSNGDIFPCDTLAVSGGWNPNVHLTCHQRGKPVWKDEIAAFTPGGTLPENLNVAGSANGTMTLGKILDEASAVTAATLNSIGQKSKKAKAHKTSDEPFGVSAYWYVKESTKRAWVDLQNDVTTKDVKQSHKEGFRSVEHLKRYTTLGMATDQGKTSNILGLAVMADVSGKTIPETGTTIFRPPYTPVPIGAFAGRARGKDFRPTRLTPTHDWAEKQGAIFVEVGAWLRAQWYPKDQETFWRDSVDREVTTTRSQVGICDVTTLGKIDIKGKDAAEFLNRIYSNGFKTLAVGKVRYGIMLREDGMVMDDGTTARLGENHYVMTTTTANAVGVFRHMEFCRQCLWPDMDVHLISITDQWAQLAVAGPKSRALLQKIIDPEFEISNEAFPFMGCSEVTVCGGTRARLFRISFSGELAYEIAVPRRFGNSLMDVLMKAGEEFGATTYGTEALSVMRIEKGHPVGNELTGTTTAKNIGLGKMVSTKKDFIGSVLYKREGLNAEDDLQLVGFKPLDPGRDLKAGAHFFGKGTEQNINTDEGWMTSVGFSPSLNTSIGLGFLKNGNERMGEIVTAYDELRGNTQDVEVVSPHFIDPEGVRLRG